ncbi:dihydrofolate reductase family protein [Pseudonocardia sp. TRM90224]|uniref:dihydrofolate reductase family protein n=1 Tax=Pseudonocardia sp. TRM90224 TaxID=2812678 RepID=UPI001E4462F4|nr:dihydrofolate reductase family protein [Pseudonocardia sp. TRM90224]
MATILYSATMSLDGFIAGPGDDMSWLADIPLDAPDPDAALTLDIGALLVGGGTFRASDPFAGTDEEGAMRGTWSGPQFVLTRNPPATPVPGVTFFDDLPEAVAAASDAAGERYVNVLGATIARGCLEAGLLDEILVYVAPLLLGDGTRLHEHAGGRRTRLTTISKYPGALHYRVDR